MTTYRHVGYENHVAKKKKISRHIDDFQNQYIIMGNNITWTSITRRSRPRQLIPAIPNYRNTILQEHTPWDDKLQYHLPFSFTSIFLSFSSLFNSIFSCFFFFFLFFFYFTLYHSTDVTLFNQLTKMTVSAATTLNYSRARYTPCRWTLNSCNNKTATNRVMKKTSPHYRY